LVVDRHGKYGWARRPEYLLQLSGRSGISLVLCFVNSMALDQENPGSKGIKVPLWERGI
jgi:hypothetical protein